MGCKRRRCTIADDLPADLLDFILARLPLREAARASVLSVAWGRSWRRLPDLDFTTTTSPSPASCSSTRRSREAIDAVLRHHSGGPVRRARFQVTDAADLPRVQRWTLSLISQQPEGLQALDLAFFTSGPPPPLPGGHAVFAPACARALRDLALDRCVLPPVVPATTAPFAGFPSLARLSLSFVSVHEARDLEAMVSTAPKLEELAMACVAVVGDDGARRHELRLASQSLRFLEMSELGSIDWVAACLPRVEHARVLDVGPDCAANVLRGMASSVNKLVYYNLYQKIELPKGLPSSYANLNRLDLGVNFGYAPAITSMIYFLKSAPNLIQLIVRDLFTDESSEESPYPWPPLGSYEIFPSLRFLRVVALCPLRNALDFVRLVLSSARMLQILEVGTAKKNTANQQIADEICRYDRVSSVGVQICVKRSYSC